MRDSSYKIQSFSDQIKKQDQIIESDKKQKQTFTFKIKELEDKITLAKTTSLSEDQSTKDRDQ